MLNEAPKLVQVVPGVDTGPQLVWVLQAGADPAQIFKLFTSKPKYYTVLQGLPSGLWWWSDPAHCWANTAWYVEWHVGICLCFLKTSQGFKTMQTE